MEHQGESPGPARLGKRLGAARRARFTGRRVETELFRACLSCETLPFQALFIHGPGGIGKTSLLRELEHLCDEARVRAVLLDGRNIEPSPSGFIGALRQALELGGDQGPEDVLAARGGRSVLLVDTYEALAPLDNWLRDAWLPRLPDDTLTVLAGRNPPSPAWRVDSGWQQLLRTVPLRNLAPDESLAYLSQRSVPETERQAVLDFTHGYPLALSLVADMFDQRGPFRFRPEAAPDVIRTLVEQLVEHIEPEQRLAIEVCSLVRLTTEPLLAELLDRADAHELFEWLRTLSFMESGPQGLFPHDLPREALVADLRWRHPERYADLHKRARAYYASRLQRARGLEQQRILFDYVFLHRDNPLMRPYLEWQETGATMPDVLRAADRPHLARMVEEHEGAESARWLEYWLDRQPEAMVVYRDEQGQPSGFLAEIALTESDAPLHTVDPAVEATWNYLQNSAPLRAGERATLFRFWMARDSYQAVSALQSLIFGRAAQHYLITPALAFSFFPVADAQFWSPMFTHVDIGRLPGAEFEIDGHRYGVFAHDWRVRPPIAWLALLGEREIASSDEATPSQAEPALVLSEPEFATAVRTALRDFSRAGALHGNPLLRSRLVLEIAGASESGALRVEALRSVLLQTALTLQTSPRQARLYQALDRTYFHPAASQEQAAELLDVPFSTYRRHLKAGVAFLSSALWQREIGAYAS